MNKENTRDRMIVSTTLPMIEIFHQKKNFRTASTSTKTARLPNQRMDISLSTLRRPKDTEDERSATPLRRAVRAEGLEPPQACAHQVLSLARLPNSATPAWLSRVLRSDTGVVSSAQEPRRVGGSRGNRTHNPRIKSPMLCLIELATHREVIRRIGEGAMAVFARSRSRPWSVSSSRWSDARGSDRRHAGDDSCDGLCRLAW